MWIWFRKPKFKEIAQNVLREKKARAPSTQVMAELRLRRLTSFFGESPVHRINETDWDKYVIWRLEQRPGSKLFDDRKYMRQVMLLAHRQGLIRKPPKLTIPDNAGTIGREIMPEEIGHLLKYASRELKFQIEIGLLMGLRLREMLHLRWDRVDWERVSVQLLSIDTKTRRGREVPIHSELVQAFQERYNSRISPFVFPSPRGPERPCNVNARAWETCKRKADVKARWHDLRHTCATRLLRAGNSTRIVRKLLGNGERVLNEIYDHPNLDDLRTAINSLKKRA